MLALASSTIDDKEKALYGYTMNKCDSVLFGLITVEGGAKEIAELYGLVGKAGPTFMINPDRSIDTGLSYRDYQIRSYFPEYGFEKADCSYEIEAPVVGFAHPKRSEVVLENQDYEVIWRAKDPDGIAASALYFSSDDGKTWKFVDSLDNGDTSYTWRVPDLNSKECRLKLHVYDTKENMKEKISIYFTIDGTSGIINKMVGEREVFKSKVINGVTNIYVPFSDESKVSIIDAKGKLVSEFKTFNDKHWYSIGKGMSPGVYVVNINWLGNVVNGKLVLRK